MIIGKTKPDDGDTVAFGFDENESIGVLMRTTSTDGKIELMYGACSWVDSDATELASYCLASVEVVVYVPEYRVLAPGEISPHKYAVAGHVVGQVNATIMARAHVASTFATEDAQSYLCGVILAKWRDRDRLSQVWGDL